MYGCITSRSLCAEILLITASPGAVAKTSLRKAVDGLLNRGARLLEL